MDGELDRVIDKCNTGKLAWQSPDLQIRAVKEAQNGEGQNNKSPMGLSNENYHATLNHP